MKSHATPSFSADFLCAMLMCFFLAGLGLVLTAAMCPAVSLLGKLTCIVVGIFLIAAAVTALLGRDCADEILGITESMKMRGQRSPRVFMLSKKWLRMASVGLSVVGVASLAQAPF